MGDPRVVIVDPCAVEMLNAHVLFLNNVSPKAAFRLVDEFYSEISSLSTLSERFPFYEAFGTPRSMYRKLPIGRRYLILYVVNDAEVRVRYVIDCRQDSSWLI